MSIELRCLWCQDVYGAKMSMVQYVCGAKMSVVLRWHAKMSMVQFVTGAKMSIVQFVYGAKMSMCYQLYNLSLCFPSYSLSQALRYLWCLAVYGTRLSMVQYVCATKILKPHRTERSLSILENFFLQP